MLKSIKINVFAYYWRLRNDALVPVQICFWAGPFVLNLREGVTTAVSTWSKMLSATNIGKRAMITETWGKALVCWGLSLFKQCWVVDFMSKNGEKCHFSKQYFNFYHNQAINQNKIPLNSFLKKNSCHLAPYMGVNQQKSQFSHFKRISL